MSLKLKTEFKERELLELLTDALKELQRACLKFPCFPDAFANSASIESANRVLSAMRKVNDSNEGAAATAYTVFGEEWCELIEAISSKRDKAEARKELVQSIAMLLRISLHLDDYIKKESDHV